MTAQDELNVLKRKYDESQQIIQEKEDTLSGKQYMIVGLCTLVVILIAGLIFVAIVLLRFIAGNRKLKKSVQNSQMNTMKLKDNSLSRNISAQMEPTLDTLASSAAELSDKAPQQAQQMQGQVAA